MAEARETKITVIEIKMVKDQLSLIGHLLTQLPLEEYLEELQRTETLGVYFDPTGWMNSREERANAESLIKPALALKRSFQSLQDKAKAENVRDTKA